MTAGSRLRDSTAREETPHAVAAADTPLLHAPVISRFSHVCSSVCAVRQSKCKVAVGGPATDAAR